MHSLFSNTGMTNTQTLSWCGRKEGDDDFDWKSLSLSLFLSYSQLYYLIMNNEYLSILKGGKQSKKQETENKKRRIHFLSGLTTINLLKTFPTNTSCI
jgi:hypothetical protein